MVLHHFLIEGRVAVRAEVLKGDCMALLEWYYPEWEMSHCVDTGKIRGYVHEEVATYSLACPQIQSLVKHTFLQAFLYSKCPKCWLLIYMGHLPRFIVGLVEISTGNWVCAVY